MEGERPSKRQRRAPKHFEEYHRGSGAPDHQAIQHEDTLAAAETPAAAPTPANPAIIVTQSIVTLMIMLAGSHGGVVHTNITYFEKSSY